MSETIPVVVSLDDQTKGVFSATSFSGLAEVPLDKLKANLTNLVTKLRAITAEINSPASDLSLKEVEVGIEITAEGGVNLIGTAKAGATASVKLTFGHQN